MPSADSDGVRIHYELAGTGDPLVLIGGLGVHTDEYWALIGALARHHRVLAADNRGAGSSDKPDEPYSYGMMAADTLAAMDAAGVVAADSVGFSMGARIAIELCLAHPERVRTLTLIAGRPAGRSRRRTRLLTRVAAVTERGGGGGMRRQLEAENGYDVRGRLADVSVPALVLHGRRDRLVPIADSRELARLMPGAELHLMPGGHLAVLRAQSDAYADRIAKGRGGAVDGGPLALACDSRVGIVSQGCRGRRGCRRWRVAAGLDGSWGEQRERAFFDRHVGVDVLLGGARVRVFEPESDDCRRARWQGRPVASFLPQRGKVLD
jgi:3-oxoadipate enol-lactonase